MRQLLAYLSHDVRSHLLALQMGQFLLDTLDSVEHSIEVIMSVDNSLYSSRILRHIAELYPHLFELFGMPAHYLLSVIKVMLLLFDELLLMRDLLVKVRDPLVQDCSVLANARKTFALPASDACLKMILRRVAMLAAAAFALQPLREISEAQ